MEGLGSDIRQPPFAREQRGKPLVERGNHGIIRKSPDAGPVGALPKHCRGWRPVDDSQAMLTYALEQSGSDALRACLRIFGSRQHDRAKVPAGNRPDTARFGIEAKLDSGLDPVRKQCLHFARLNRGSGKDSRARGRALNIGHGEPFAARKRARWIEPEAPAATADPMLPSRVAPPGKSGREGASRA